MNKQTKIKMFKGFVGLLLAIGFFITVYGLLMIPYMGLGGAVITLIGLPFIWVGMNGLIFIITRKNDDITI